jgi:hypothetical protein
MLNESTRKEERAQAIIQRYESTLASRGTLDTQCEEIARRILPNYVGTFHDKDHYRTRQAAQPNTQEMYDATGALALTRFAAAMESMLTPRNSQWHSLQPSDNSLKKRRTVQLWFEELTQTLFKYRYAPNANFASQQHENYMALGAFGSGTMFIDKLQARYGAGLRYRAVHLGEVHFCENHQGIIDTVIRRFTLTARQAVQKFPQGLPEKILNAAKDQKQYDTPFPFIHYVTPREDYNPGRLDASGMAYQSEYVSIEGKGLLADEGYSSFPYAISRYVIAPGETYGRSPAMLVLPSLKVLNEQKKTVLKQGQRVVDPVLLAHDDGVLDNFSMRAGALNYGGVSADGKPLVHVLPTGNIAVCKDLMDDERAVINDAFLVTLFQILTETPEMTATEVIERTREKGALLSPTMGRQQSESLGPMIEREVDLLQQQKLISPMPDILRQAQGQYTVEYDSPLSRAQKAEGISGFFRFVDWVQTYIGVTGDKRPLDFLNWDEAAPEILRGQAVPVKWVNALETVQALRQQQAQAAQQQQLVDAAPALASVAKPLMAGAKQ